MSIKVKILLVNLTFKSLFPSEKELAFGSPQRSVWLESFSLVDSVTSSRSHKGRNLEKLLNFSFDIWEETLSYVREFYKYYIVPRKQGDPVFGIGSIPCELNQVEKVKLLFALEYLRLTNWILGLNSDVQYNG